MQTDIVLVSAGFMLKPDVSVLDGSTEFKLSIRQGQSYLLDCLLNSILYYTLIKYSVQNGAGSSESMILSVGS